MPSGSDEDKRDQSSNVRVTDENSGTIITISGENNGNLSVEQGGDKEVVEKGVDGLTNAISYIFQWFFETSIGQSLDLPLKIIGWLTILVFVICNLSIYIANFAPLLGYDRIGEIATQVALFYSELIQTMSNTLPISLALFAVLSIIVLYAFVRWYTACNECGPFMIKSLTRKHHDRARYDEKLEEYITPEEKVFECKNCGGSKYGESS